MTMPEPAPAIYRHDPSVVRRVLRQLSKLLPSFSVRYVKETGFVEVVDSSLRVWGSSAVQTLLHCDPFHGDLDLFARSVSAYYERWAAGPLTPAELRFLSRLRSDPRTHQVTSKVSDASLDLVRHMRRNRVVRYQVSREQLNALVNADDLLEEVASVFDAHRPEVA